MSNLEAFLKYLVGKKNLWLHVVDTMFELDFNYKITHLAVNPIEVEYRINENVHVLHRTDINVYVQMKDEHELIEENILDLVLTIEGNLSRLALKYFDIKGGYFLTCFMFKSDGSRLFADEDHQFYNSLLIANPQFI
jgi:hypothetical protein